MSLSLLQFSPVCQTAPKVEDSFYGRDFARTASMKSPVQRAKQVTPSLCQCLPLCTQLSKTFCLVGCGMFAVQVGDWFEFLNSESCLYGLLVGWLVFLALAS